jgi:hypothetical protein
MSSHRIRSGIGILLLGTSLALAPMSMASASHGKTTHQKAKHKTAKHSHKPAKTSSAAGVCSYLNNAGGSSKFASVMEAAFKSGNFVEARQSLLNLFAEIAKDVPGAEAAMKSTPADVQSAFKTMISFDAQVQTDVENATSFTQLDSALAPLGQDATLSAASTTFGNYADAKCKG